MACRKMNEDVTYARNTESGCKFSKRKWRLTSVHLYVTQSDFTREEARLPMVGNIFLIWDGLGVGGGGGGQLPKKTPAQRKSAKKYNAK